MARHGLGFEIFSIFGECEAVVARQMIEEGKGRFIESRAIPSSQWFNDAGQSAQFAVAMPGKNIREFEQRIQDLRS